ncbi:MAG: DUF695 domain-containing protein [Muribaculaceae bacterium]|nr:DUF695 domain-containing protein [Muribaculaceae bacterium]
MNEKEDWWTSPAEGENGNLIMVTGRRDIEKFRKNPRYKIRIEVTWAYGPTADGMPDRATSEMMEKVQDLLQETFAKDPVAVLTGIYTGDNRRNWVFYSTSTHIFGRKINETLSSLPTLPLSIYCENDPDWAEYAEMKELTEIDPE